MSELIFEHHILKEKAYTLKLEFDYTNYLLYRDYP